jgi:thiamine biosynthesis lipoprotein
MGLDEGIKYWSEHDGFDVVFVTDDNGIYITEGIADIFESKYNYSVIKKTAN